MHLYGFYSKNNTAIYVTKLFKEIKNCSEN